nr:hypothetical protein [Nocardioides convexus]
MHAPWALAINARLRERFGVDGQAMASDDGIVIRIPDTDAEPPGADLIAFEPDEIEEVVTREVGGSALFAARFRECAARALLLPRRDPGRRSPLWQQRQRAAALLEVASRYPSFPIVLETVREVLNDVYDLPGLTTLLRRVEQREVTVTEVETNQPSPYARTLMFGYVAQFVYEGDSPLAERRAAALTLDQGLLAEPARPGGACASLLDPDVLAEARGRACSGRSRTAVPATPRAWPTCSGCSARSPRPRSPPAPARRRRSRSGWPTWSAPAGWSRSGWPTARRGPPSRTSPGCATASVSPSRPAPPPPSPSRSRTRSRTSSGATPAPTGRSPPTRSPPGWASASPSSGTPCSGWRPRAASCRVSSGRSARARSGATSRCCAGCGAARWPGCATRSSPSSPPRWPGSPPPGTRSPPPGDRAVRTACCAPWSRLAGAPVPASGLESLILPARVRDYEPALLDETHRDRRGALGRARRPARQRRLDLAAPGRPGAPHPARAGGGRGPAAAAGARRAEPGRGVVLPPGRRPGGSRLRRGR